MGRMHATVWGKVEGARLVGVVDRDPERREPFAAEFGVPGFPDLASAQAAVAFDAVDVCLPTDRHAEFTIQAVALGKHVLCEKPMALDLPSADAMIAAAREAGVRLMIAHCIRFWPEYVWLKTAVDEERYGRLLSLDLNRYGAFPTWSSEGWLADETRSGGAALDMHIHDTDFARHLLGDPETLASWGTVDDRGVSQIFTTMSFGDTIVQAQGGWNLPAGTPFKMAYRAILERASAIFDAGSLTVYEEGEEPFSPEFPKTEVVGGGNVSDLGGYLHEIEEFVRCVAAGEDSSRCTPESSRESLALVLEEIGQAKARTQAPSPTAAVTT